MAKTIDVNQLPLLLKVPIAVSLSGISRAKLYEYIGSGQLDRVKIGRATRIPTSSLLALVASLSR
jgi:predicted DNA-binding transcriptional regulator AlpA